MVHSDLEPEHTGTQLFRENNILGHSYLQPKYTGAQIFRGNTYWDTALQSQNNVRHSYLEQKIWGHSYLEEKNWNRAIQSQNIVRDNSLVPKHTRAQLFRAKNTVAQLFRAKNTWTQLFRAKNTGPQTYMDTAIQRKKYWEYSYLEAKYSGAQPIRDKRLWHTAIQSQNIMGHTYLVEQ